MSQVFLMSLNEAEFKAYLKQALMEVLKEVTLNTIQIPPDILNLAEAASFLKCEQSTIYEKTSKKLIPHFKKGKRLYFHRAELEAWLRQGKVKTREELQSEAATYTMLRHKNAA